MSKLDETIETYENDVARYVQTLEFPLPRTDLDYFISLLSGNKVLDAGCGAGRDSEYLFSNGLDVTGVDMSKNMLAAARKRTCAKFEIGDIRKTRFKDNFFQGIWCYNTLLHLNQEDIQETGNEFQRILKNRGFLYVATRCGAGEISKESGMGIKHFFLYQEENLREVFESVGFETVFSKKYVRADQSFVDIVFRG